jgi:hypothetical protein
MWYDQQKAREKQLNHGRGGAVPRLPHPDEDQAQLYHKSRNSVSNVQHNSVTDTSSHTGSAPFPMGSQNPVGVRNHGNRTQRQQTSQGVTEDFSGFPTQGNPHQPKSPGNQTFPASEGSQHQPGASPAEDNNIPKQGFSSPPTSKSALKSPDWDPARLTSFMTAAASLREADLKFLNSSMTYQQFEAELSQLSGNSTKSSQGPQTAMSISPNFNTRVICLFIHI